MRELRWETISADLLYELSIRVREKFYKGHLLHMQSARTFIKKLPTCWGGKWQSPEKLTHMFYTGLGNSREERLFWGLIGGYKSNFHGIGRWL